MRRGLSERDFANSRAIVFCFNKKKKGESIGFVKRYATLASQHGLLIVLHAEENRDIRLLQSHLPDFPDVLSKFDDFSRPVRVFSQGRPAYELAELAVRHPVGPRYKADLKIKGQVPENLLDAFLLRRAFGDCQSITLEPLKKGLSGARVFSVYAEFPQGEAAPYPLPYFAKIDTCEHILTEYEAYDRFVTRYVPFSQRPNCETKRCFLTSNVGILVGDFVDNSESFAEIVQPNGARAIIHSLFDDALRGWRQQAFNQNHRISLIEFRPKILKPEQIKPKHVSIASGYGAVLTPTELTRLLDESATHRYRRGPVHGDLTTQNIRVRNGEAILIDFCKSNIGPLVADLASLEIATCFSMESDIDWNVELQNRYQESPRFKEWRRHIDKLFNFVADEFGMLPPLQEQPCAHTWMWSACRQLRLMAHYIEPNERAYAYILAAYMLRMAMFPENESDIEADTPSAIIRGYAYWCAERILRTLTAKDKAA